MKVEKIAGVEAVDTIMEAAQARFFARAVADPSAVGDLWSASLNPVIHRPFVPARYVINFV